MKNINNYNRLLSFPNASFFLFGPRGVGKSSWVKEHFKDRQETVLIDLLNAKENLELTANPSLLEAKIFGVSKNIKFVCIDEIQKTPVLLDEIHRLMEGSGRDIQFLLSGSSARKLKRAGADLLGGRAIQINMEGLAFGEMLNDYDFEKAVEWGTLPLVTRNYEEAVSILETYVHTYLKEEIREETNIRRIEPFYRFIMVAGLMNAQTINYENIAKEAKISSQTVINYFSILIDTLVGHFLPAYTPKIKVREVEKPRFYWLDSGVARASAGLLRETLDPLWKGFAFETLIFHELRVYNETSNKKRPLFYYAAHAGGDIDFIIETRKGYGYTKAEVILIECKISKTWKKDYEKTCRSFREAGTVDVRASYGVYFGDEALSFKDFDVLPVKIFLEKLYRGEIF